MGKRIEDACCCCFNCCENPPTEVTLSITNSTCGLQDGDYTLTLNGDVYEGDIDCDDATTVPVTLSCGEVTDIGQDCHPFGWRLTSVWPCSMDEGSLNYTCDPFSVIGQNGWAGGCCDCGPGPGDSFDWEVAE